ncbi:MAG: peptidase M28 [Flavobacteriales bacterium]|nr:MAG: peptidase M28 [Flavobacteriales bacterium]
MHSAIGASDAASGVAVILETLRIYLKSGQKPKNDIIILFTDAEEIGLLGASTFVNEHPWAKNIGLVLNFEARGSGGPSYMLLETNGGNKNLIEHFRAAKTPYPVANSLVYSIYKMLPNDTDLTIFRENADIDGFNFAFIDDHYDYHTAQDKPSRLDTNTLAHQATYLWPLLTYFSNADLGTLKADSELAYVTLPYFGLISYPFSWVSPMTFGLTIIFFAIVFIGIIRGKLQLKPILTGFLPMCLFLALSGLMAYFGWQFITYIHPQYHDILHGFTYNGHWYIAAFISLTIALGMLIYNLYFKKYSVRNLFVAPLFLWLVINCILAIYLPGAGFFSITVIIGLFYLSVYIFKEKLRYRPLWFSLLSVPVLFIFVPLIVMFPVALGLKMLFISTIFTSLIFVIMSPVFSSFIPQKTGKLFLFLSILLFITASFKSGYTVDRKKPNSLIYILDTDKNKAYWVSYDHTLDDYTKQALGNKPLNGSYDSLTITSKYRTQIKWHIETKPKRIIEPSIKILSDTIIGNNRRINITIAPQRSVNRIELFTVQPLTFSEFTVNGKPYPENKKENYVLKTTKTHNQLINYYFTESNEQLRLQIAIDKNQKPDLMLYEVSYDLLESMQFNLTPRSEEMMTKPFVVNDAIIVKKRISFE